MPSLGLQEWIVIFLIVLLIFGPSNLPKVGRALGKSIREFKDALSGIGSAIEREEAEREKDRLAAVSKVEPANGSARDTDANRK